jgi:DNA-binding transcriptional ArsR family regulator
MTVTRQAVTKHLLPLEEANLVTVVWQGREKLHYEFTKLYFFGREIVGTLKTILANHYSR